ncbi:APC family permease [Microbacterium hominis]|uniref:APC family permease n=1 Tax=Microbacterium TaxID=33882 RepID=UPI00168AC573|nr:MULTISPECIES: APC family permease [Microbacterium]QOC27083.1 APC family permease [Microbacterium hominis]QOC28240.1 APC family permease [Microbacterium hominis]QYF96581.1 APC family permease [Microbacterium sp. PAMC21962]
MSTTTPTPSAPADPSGAIGALKQNSLGARGITFLVVSAAAPLTVIAGTVPLAILIAGPAAPSAYLVVGIALAIFAAGFMAMTNRVSRTGGFYTYIAAALGKHMGLGSGILALVSYNAMQIGIYGLFAVNTRAMLATVFGIDVPWGILAAVAIAGVWAMGFTGIDMGAKVLGVLLVAETLALAALGVAILVTGGTSAGFGDGVFAPENVFTPQFAVVLGLAFAAFIGFESTVLYRSEARTPHRTIPRATYVAVAAMTLFYFALTWLLIQAHGEDLVQAFIADNGVETFLFVTAGSRLGEAATSVFLLLIVTSVFAALLAFHNSINRYTYALARDGVLPAALGRTRERNGAPWVAGLVQTALAAVVVGGFALAGADPYRQLLIWVNTPGVVGVVVLQILAAASVVVFFVRRGPADRPWYALPTGLLGGVLMLVFLVLIVVNIDVLTGADAATNAVIVGVIPVSFLIGLVLAEGLRRSRPAAYAGIGGPEQ